MVWGCSSSESVQLALICVFIRLNLAGLAFLNTFLRQFFGHLNQVTLFWNTNHSSVSKLVSNLTCLVFFCFLCFKGWPQSELYFYQLNRTEQTFMIFYKLFPLSYGKPENPVTCRCDGTSHKSVNQIKRVNNLQRITSKLTILHEV